MSEVDRATDLALAQSVARKYGVAARLRDGGSLRSTTNPWLDVPLFVAMLMRACLIPVFGFWRSQSAPAESEA